MCRTYSYALADLNYNLLRNAAYWGRKGCVSFERHLRDNFDIFSIKSFVMDVH